MRANSLTVPRILALLGVTLIVIASILPWQQYDVVVTSAAGSAARAHGGVDLWSVDPIAGVLTAAAALAAALLLFAGAYRRRVVRHVAGALGLAVAAYALLRWLNAPAVASVIDSSRPTDVLSGGASVGEGIFSTLLGGAALVLSAMESAVSTPAAFAPVVLEIGS